MKQIDADFNVTGAVDPEVRQRWYPLGIEKGYDDVMAPSKKFAQEMGRWKYVKPIYAALVDSDQKEMAIQWFQEKADFYHPYVVEQLKKLLKIEDDEEPSALVERWNDKFLSGPVGKSKFVF